MKWTEERKEEAFNDICKLISEGEPLRKVIDNYSDMPSRETFYNWIDHDRLKNPTEEEKQKCNERLEQYARAKEERAEKIFNEILDIADDSGSDKIITEEGKTVLNHEFVQRSRLRIDARKWMLGKMQPKKYGEKIDLTSLGEKLESSSTVINLGEGIKPKED